MIPFDEIDARLEKLGLDRKWLASVTPYKASYIRDVLAENSTRRTDRIMSILSDAIEKEETRRKAGDQKPQELPPCHLVIKVDVDEFNGWERLAASKSPAQAVTDYCVAAIRAAYLEDLAAAEKRADSRSNIVNISDSEQIVSRFSEVPLIRAAAGSPIISDAETIEVDRDLGPGRFLLELRGDSMEPRFKDRQRIVLRDKNTLKRPVLKYGEFYAFVHEGQACFKQWAKDSAGNKVLRSLNPDHADIPATEETDWIGWFDLNDQ